MPECLGYCTNVHAGADLAATRQNLERHALGVKQRVSPRAPMGVGLWLAAPAARRLLSEGQTPAFAEWLAEVGLNPYTFNGFPHGDFHEPVVKHRVYLPTWWEPARLDYTRDLVAAMDGLLPPGQAGSISTLPIAWGTPPPTAEQLRAAAGQLRTLADELAELEQTRGRRIRLAIEPEPGCWLERSADVTRFFEEHLCRGLQAAAAERVRRHVGVCHDVCHAVVMFEEQADVLARYAAAGIAVPKMQISSAVRCRFDPLATEERGRAREQFAAFREPRYLHQTCVRFRQGEYPQFFEDLPLALESAPSTGEWRVHFHVPIFLERWGLLEGSQEEILDCLRAVEETALTCDFEVETYAWGVLPPELRLPDLASGIARELDWFSAARAAVRNRPSA